MIKWVGVLPYAYQPYFDECIATMHKDFKKHVLFVDNSTEEKNRGIPSSHNLGIQKMYEENADWLVIMSAGRLGPKVG